MDFDEIVIETDRLAFPALAMGTGSPVVCWHGFPDHPATFGKLAERLVAAGRRVVAPFLRGHHPDTADALGYADGITLAADAAAVAEALADRPGEGVDMIGHDIGAGVVARVAAAWPETVRRGVIMSVPAPAALPSILTDPAQLRRSFYIWLFTLDGLPEMILERDRRLIDFLWDTWSPGFDPGPHRQLVHELYGDPRFIRNALRIYRGNFDTSLHDPSLSHVAARTETPASKPLLLIAGSNDGCIDASLFTSDGLASGSRVEILAGPGHFPHLEQPASIATLTLDWFA